MKMIVMNMNRLKMVGNVLEAYWVNLALLRIIETYWVMDGNNKDFNRLIRFWFGEENPYQLNPLACGGSNFKYPNNVLSLALIRKRIF